MDTTPETPRRDPALWVPSLYFSEGVPYAIVVNLSVIMYARLGVSMADITFYTGWLYLPWVIKPLWSPLVDMTRTKRRWIVSMQYLGAAALFPAAAVIMAPSFFPFSLLLFLLIAFASATHDIAADGFYMLGLSPHQQALWVGIRSLFFRGAMIFGSGLLPIVAGELEKRLGVASAWSIALLLAAALYFLFAIWHHLILPRPANDKPERMAQSRKSEFLATFKSYFGKPGVGMAVAFILLYRLDEAQLSAGLKFFLLGDRKTGGLGVGPADVGWATGTCGVVALTFGGILGGFAVARYGLKRMLPVMLGFMYLPKLAYICLAFAQSTRFAAVVGAISLEQFGYGFGFVAFMLYLLYFSDGPHRTAHYAICTGFMALGMMIPGMWSGLLVEKLGYRNFFIWVMVSAIPGLITTLHLKVDPHFGKK